MIRTLMIAAASAAVLALSPTAFAQQTGISRSANAMTVWFFEGRCFKSYLKWGTPNDDLRKEAGDPITCEKAVLGQLPNGRVLMQFVTERGVLGFSGGGIDRETNPTMSILPVDRILPIRDYGQDTNEILKRSARGEGALNGAEGFCFFQSKDIDSSTQLSCTSKWEQGNKKVVYKVLMNITKASKKLLPSSQN